MGDSFKVMQKEHRIVLRIIQSAITKEDTEQLLENEGDGEFSWDLVYKLLCKNSLDGVTYPYVSKLAKEFGPPEKLMDLWKQGVLLKAIRQLKLVIRFITHIWINPLLYLILVLMILNWV